MTFLIGLFLKWGVAERFARPLAIGVAIIAAIALCASLWTCWLSKHDDAVVQADRDKANLEVVEAIVKADRAADAKANERVKEFQDEQEGLRNEAAKGDETLAGPGTTAVLNDLRRARK